MKKSRGHAKENYVPTGTPRGRAPQGELSYDEAARIIGCTPAKLREYRDRGLIAEPLTFKAVRAFKKPDDPRYRMAEGVEMVIHVKSGRRIMREDWMSSQDWAVAQVKFYWDMRMDLVS